MTSPPATSASPQPRARPSRVSPGWPTIVAESLFPVVEPLATVLQGGPIAEPLEVASALAASLAPPEAPVNPPEWLWPAQRRGFRRVLAALTRYGGALLADPVGTGKTYVALAVAEAVNGGRRTVCLVPAALGLQWQRAATRTGVRIMCWSHERVSRGTLPEHDGSLVIVDESHRLRNPDTRLHQRLADWLLGHRILMLSATPVVNRLSDLSHQLRLAVPDDALAPHGVPSLARLLGQGRGHPALGLLVLSSADPDHGRPRAADRTERPGAEPDASTPLDTLGALALSPDPPVAALLRHLLWRSAASSPAALGAMLRRYRRLLLHAQDAARSGRRPDRRTLIRLSGGAGDQLVMWDLLPPTQGPVDLALDDLSLLDDLIARTAAAAARDDPKLARLRMLLADARPTIVFSVSRETVRWLRDRLGPRVAWCTGDRAGIGSTRLPRDVVFGWFDAMAPVRRREPPEGAGAPLHLVSTDVAAEGLDLQGAARVVHYDLPWTPTRLDQRRGRIVRAGSPHAEVEIVRLEPAPALERELRQVELLDRKATLPALVGLGERGWWAWRTALAGRFGGLRAVRGAAACVAEPAGILAGFCLHSWPGSGEAPLSVHLVWWEPECGWTEEPDTIAARLEQCRSAARAPLDWGDLRAALGQLGRVVRERMRAVREARWEAPAPASAARRLLTQLERLGREAACRRDAASLARVRRAIAAAARGHTAGEVRAMERLTAAPDAELLAALNALPGASPLPSALEARVTGVILFRGGLTFPRWAPSAPSCSTSTARSSTPSG